MRIARTNRSADAATIAAEAAASAAAARERAAEAAAHATHLQAQTPAAKSRRRRPGKRTTLFALAAAVILGGAAYAIAGSREAKPPIEASLIDYSTPSAGVKTADATLRRDPEEKYSHPETRTSKRARRKAGIPQASATTRVAPGAASDAELRGELRTSRKQAGGNANGVTLLPDGTALAPFDAPPEVQSIVAAANTIAKFPYIWGGGHGSFSDVGYDCSGSLSYALRAAALVEAPLVSGQLAHWGVEGPGKWITVYAHGGHTFMVVGGLRYDTSFRDGPRGSRWQDRKRSYKGFAVRHWPGL